MNQAKKLDLHYIERSRDTELVRSILSDETLRNRSGCHVPVDAYDPENQDDIYYLVPYLNGLPVGVTVVHIFNNPVCVQIHVNYLPKYWGKGLDVLSKMALNWIWSNLEVNKVVAFAPDTYPEVKKHAEKCGMKSEGYLPGSTEINGKLDNQHIMGIERCQQQQQS